MFLIKRLLLVIITLNLIVSCTVPNVSKTSEDKKSEVNNTIIEKKKDNPISLSTPTPIPENSENDKSEYHPINIDLNNEKDTPLTILDKLQFVGLELNIYNNARNTNSTFRKYLNCSIKDEKTIQCEGSYSLYECEDISLTQVEISYKDNNTIHKIPIDKFEKIVTSEKNSYNIFIDYTNLKTETNLDGFKYFINLKIPPKGLYLDEYGSTSDIKERAIFSGIVKDPYGNDVKDAKVNARSIDPGFNWVGETQETTNSEYVFRNAPINAKVEITASKDGWTTRKRIEVTKSEFNIDPCAIYDKNANKFDFVGQYSLQDEPEITEVLINGRKAIGVGSISATNRIPNNDDVVTLSSVTHDNLEITLNFSEPVRRDDIQNYFRVVSQNFDVLNNNNFIIDENISGETFTWNENDTSVTFKTNKAILANKGGNEARYKLEFTQPFRDKTDKKAIEGQYIRFSPSTQGDFTLFSVKNDEKYPALSSLQAIDGGSNNDKLVLTFNEPFEVINRSVVQSGLADPSAPNTAVNQLWLASTNNATLLGFSDNGTNQGFKTIYTIGRIVNAQTNTKLIPLNGYGWNDSKNLLDKVNPKRANTEHPLLATLYGNQVVLEFRSTAFSRDEFVVLSIGDITGNYEDKENNIIFEISTNSEYEKGEITDPSGRKISNDNSSTSANITINDSQKVSRVSG